MDQAVGQAKCRDGSTVHKVETEYYERFVRDGLTNAHRTHNTNWP